MPLSFALALVLCLFLLFFHLTKSLGTLGLCLPGAAWGVPHEI